MTGAGAGDGRPTPAPTPRWVRFYPCRTPGKRVFGDSIGRSGTKPGPIRQMRMARWGPNRMLRRTILARWTRLDGPRAVTRTLRSIGMTPGGN
jgi:hypothetical protein